MGSKKQDAAPLRRRGEKPRRDAVRLVTEEGYSAAAADQAVDVSERTWWARFGPQPNRAARTPRSTSRAWRASDCGEDHSRLRKGHADAHFSILRRTALSLLKNNQTHKLGVKNKRLAAWSDDYLQELLFG